MGVSEFSSSIMCFVLVEGAGEVNVSAGNSDVMSLLP